MHSGPTGDTASPPARMPLFWTPKQVAEALQVTSRTVARWIESGALAARDEYLDRHASVASGQDRVQRAPAPAVPEGHDPVGLVYDPGIANWARPATERFPVRPEYPRPEPVFRRGLLGPLIDPAGTSGNHDRFAWQRTDERNH